MSARLMAAVVLAALFLPPLSGREGLAQAPSPKPRASSPFFPMAVWYSGGKARAPMIAPLTAGSEREWRADLQKIKDLGFNTVRTWVEWSAGEPRQGEFRLENFDLMLRLAEEVGLRVIVQVYVD